MSTLSKMPNVGKVLEKNLSEIGINTPDELRSIGAKEAFIRIRTIDSGACLHMLYGLQGAVEGVKDTTLSDEVKSDLKLFFKSLYKGDTSMNNEINWLLEDENPEVKYRTMTELLDMSKDEPEVKKVCNRLLSSDAVSLIMDRFKLNTKWDDVTALIALAEFGLTRNDISTDDYIERIIKSMSLKYMKCSKILLLRNLVSLGYYEHEWVKDQIFSSFSTIREDGTFQCLDKGKRTNDSKLSAMGCYRQTTLYLLLAAELKKIGVVLSQFEQLINFYINSYVAFHPDNPERVIIEEMAGTYYPFDHVNLGLQMTMYGLSVLGAANHPNCNKAWALLDSKKDSNSKYVLDKSYPYFEVGKVGEPNKWITLYVLLSEKYRML